MRLKHKLHDEIQELGTINLGVITVSYRRTKANRYVQFIFHNARW